MSKTTDKPAAKKKAAAQPRRQRTIEERIAELQEKQAAQLERRRRTALRQYEAAVAQRDTARERLARIEAAVANLAEELGFTEDSENGEPAQAADLEPASA